MGSHYEVRAWASSSNAADGDRDGVVEVGRYPGDAAGLAEGAERLRGLMSDAPALLAACMESGISPDDFAEMGVGLFEVAADPSGAGRASWLATFSIPFGEDGKPSEPVVRERG